MATTPRGIWTPDSVDDYNLVIDLQAMADSIDDDLQEISDTVDNGLQAMSNTIDGLLARLPFAMAAGRLVLNQNYQTVTLPPGRFTQPPRVFIQPASGASSALGATALVTNETVSSFQARMLAGEGGGTSVACNWVAVQMTSTNADG